MLPTTPALTAVLLPVPCVRSINTQLPTPATPAAAARTPAAPQHPAHSLQRLRLLQRTLVACQRRRQREQAVDQEDSLVGGVQVRALVHAAQKGGAHGVGLSS